MFQKKIPLRGPWPYWGIESRYDCNFMRLKLMFDSKACVSTFICVLPLLSSASIWGAPIAHLIKQHTVHKPTVKNRFKPSNCPPIDKEMKQTLHGNLSKKKQQNFGRKFLKDFGGKKKLENWKKLYLHQTAYCKRRYCSKSSVCFGRGMRFWGRIFHIYFSMQLKWGRFTLRTNKASLFWRRV